MKNINFLKNSLFEGVVTHSRVQPFAHKFKYFVTYFWFDIINFEESLFFKRNKFSLFSFYDKDHGELKKRKEHLYEVINKNIEKITKEKISYIKLFCIPRILGYVFNPISVFVCFDKKERAKVVIFEVNNTFKERHSYYCKVFNNTDYFHFKKTLYVSPFFKVKGNYKIKLRITKEMFFLYILYEINKEKVFDASFNGKLVELNSLNLIKVFFKKIFQNLKITTGIYFQALKLYAKGAKYIKKPLKPNKDFSSIK